jgi:stage II sporulation protein D
MRAARSSPSAKGAAIVPLALVCLAVCCSRAPAPAKGPEPSAVVGAEPTVRVVLLTGVKSVTLVSGGTLSLEWTGGAGTTWAGGGACRVYCTGGGAGISAQGPDGAALDLGHGPLEIGSSRGMLEMEGRDYRGSMRTVRESDGTLTVINLVGLESYLRGVLPSEIGALSEGRMAAMKAQAVASRSYTLYKMARSRDRSYDVVSGVGDQVYKGVSGERGITDRAVAETFGEVAVYGGEPIRANFSSTCGGVTVDNDEAWPDDEPLPYLRSVRDVAGRRGAELCGESRHHRWRVEWSAEELTSILSSHYGEGGSEGGQFSGNVTDVKVTKRNEAGRARVVEIKTDRGKYEVRADKMRWALRRPDGGPLRSTFFELNLEKRRGRVRKLVALGRGWGHGVGMCQWGAIGMADRGSDYREILHHYYTGIDIVRMYGPPA